MLVMLTSQLVKYKLTVGLPNFPSRILLQKFLASCGIQMSSASEYFPNRAEIKLSEQGLIVEHRDGYWRHLFRWLATDQLQ